MLLRLLDESQEFAVVTFNNLGYNLSFEQSEAPEDEEKNRKNIIYGIIFISHIDILMDHPFHYEKPLCNMPGNSSDPLHRPQSCEIYPAFFKTSIRQISFHMQEWNWDISINL